MAAEWTKEIEDYDQQRETVRLAREKWISAMIQIAGAAKYVVESGAMEAGTRKMLEGLLAQERETFGAYHATAHGLIKPSTTPADPAHAKSECNGFEVEPGVFSGCNAAKTGATDCPTCGTTEVADAAQC